ncbi:MAG: exonuclease domain-containing protein [Acutalibacteraceae bacterium]
MLNKFVAFDVEMPSQSSLRISAIGITVVENGEITKQIYSLINPEADFDPFIVDLIGITPQMVADKPTFAEFWPEIQEIMESGLLVAHGAACDLMALSACLKHYNIPWLDKVAYACTCDLGLLCYPYLEKHSLDVLCGHIGFGGLDHHNALSDSEGCARLMLNYIESGVDIEKNLCTFDLEHGHKVHTNRIRKPRVKKTLEQKIQFALFKMSDAKLRDKKIKKNPDVDPEKIIGVSPERVCSYAARLIKDNKAPDFAKILPHTYLEENDLHARIISGKGKYSSCVKMIDEFLPYIESEETCEQLRPKIFKSRQPELTGQICTWASSENPFAQIIAINFMSLYFFSEEYLPFWLDYVCGMNSENIDVNRKRAEFFARALLKFEDITLPYFEHFQIDKWTHNMALQIAAFSKNISDEKHEFFVSMRIKNKSAVKTEISAVQ